MKTCSVDGCAKAHRARGLCSTHYNQANVKRVTVSCAACGEPVAKSSQRNRTRYRAVCSLVCRSYVQHGPTSCPVPSSHPSRMPLVCEVPASHPSRARSAALLVGFCSDCGQRWEHVNALDYCSRRCKLRAARRRRRAREAGASGSFTWDGFMRLALSLGNRCAYCDDQPDYLLEPDHVVPLSRGGHNGLTNILPACKPCNSGKRDYLLYEWAAVRVLRGQPPRRTDVSRFTHLVLVDPIEAHAA